MGKRANNQKTRLTSLMMVKILQGLEPEVYLCVKVQLSLRRLVAAKAKRQETTMTAATLKH